LVTKTDRHHHHESKLQSLSSALGEQKMKRCSLLAALLLLLNLCSVGQTPTGTLLGLVTDESGAAVVGATVHVTNTGTNETKDLQTDEGGRYVVPFLSPGNYTVSVEAQGFSSVRTENVKLDVSQNRSVDFSLRVGSVSTQVDVQAAVTPLDHDSATLGQVIDTKKVVDLPLNGRNPFSLATLVPV